MAVRIGSRTIQLNHAPSIVGFAAVGAKKEKEGPLADYFDYLSEDSSFGEKTWEKAETLLYTALIGYLCGVVPEEDRNFAMLVSMINAMEVREDDEDFKNPVDLMFEALEEREPEHFAVRQYHKYKLAAGVVCSKYPLNHEIFS